MRPAAYLPPCATNRNITKQFFRPTGTHFTKPMAIPPRSAPAIFSLSQDRSAAVPTPPPPDFGRQVRLAFGNPQATLEAAGCSFADIVDVTTFHTDPENQFETIMAVKNQIFNAPPYPNWTAVGVNWLAGFDFEIKVIARVPEEA